MSQSFPPHHLWALSDWKACRADVLAVFRKYQTDDSKSGRKFFISFNGCTYAPKEIRSILERRPVKAFSGGGRTNEIFRQLGFTVVKGTEKLSLYKRTAAKQAPTPSLREMDRLLATLFKQKWADLKTELGDHRVSRFPGVYLLAYSPKPLADTSVRLEDIFYVGMSTTALRVRLGQFWTGIHDGRLHSASQRFYRRWAGGRSFSKLHTRNQFFVATLPVECEPRKGLRTSADLIKLGIVAALEYLALAKIKRELDLEPPLNKK